MSKLRYSFLRHHKSKTHPGMRNVKIAVPHKGYTGYIATDLWVDESILTADLKIKDNNVLREVLDVMKPYEDIRKNLYFDISDMTASELAQKLEELKKKLDRTSISASTISFVNFAEGHIAKLRKEGKQGITDIKVLERKRKRKEDRERYADRLQKTLWSLIDFFGHANIMVTDITAKMLERYRSYLKGPRTMTRLNQGKMMLKINTLLVLLMHYSKPLTIMECQVEGPLLPHQLQVPCLLLLISHQHSQAIIAIV